MSKHDAFWICSLAQLRDLIEQAATRGAAQAGFSEIDGSAPRGRKASSWKGKVRVRGQQITKSNPGAAHLHSLANVLANRMVCARHGDTEFTFHMDPGRVLTVTSSSGPPAGSKALLDEVPCAPGDLPASLLADPCAAIHACLECLPFMTGPHDPTFQDGLYFHYEDGEVSLHAPSGRIVRIGNHPHAVGGLVARIKKHYAPHEQVVTGYLRTHTRFRCVWIPDTEERSELETRLIAIIAACRACRPSGTWLGLHAGNEKIRRSGTWNVRGVDDAVADRRLIERLAALVSRTPGFNPSISHRGE